MPCRQPQIFVVHSLKMVMSMCSWDVSIGRGFVRSVGEGGRPLEWGVFFIHSFMRNQLSHKQPPSN